MRFLSGVKSLLGDRRRLLALMLVAGCALAYSLMMYRHIIVQKSGQETTVATQAIKSYRIALGNGDVVTQDISWDGVISSFSLWLERYGVGAGIGTVTLSVIDASSSERLAASSVTIGSLIGKSETKFPLDRVVQFQPGKLYRIQVNVSLQDAESQRLMIWYGTRADGVIEGLPAASVNGRAVNGALTFSLVRSYRTVANWYLVLLALMTAAMIVIGVLSYKTRIRTHWLFFVAALLLGTAYQLAMPAFSNQDEEVHYATSYDLSSRLLGLRGVDFKNDLVPTETKGSYIVYNDRHDHDHYYINVRETDFRAVSILRRYLGKDEYYAFFEQLQHGAGGSTAEKSAVWTESVLRSSPLVYLPGTLGITAGRLFHMDGLSTVLLGRFLNMLLYILIVASAIRLMPSGKLLLTACALLPSSIEVAASYSYDALNISVMFLFIAVFMQVIQKRKQAGVGDYLVFAICAYFFGCSKMLYSVVLLAMLLVPDGRLNLRDGRRWRWLLILCAIAGFSIAITYIQGMVDYVQKIQVNNMHTFSEILKRPLWFAYTCLKSISIFIWKYLDGMFGVIIGQLGTNQVKLDNGWIGAMFMVLLGYSAAARGKSTKLLSTSARVIVLVICALVMLLLLVVAFTWNPESRSFIDGVQGRYLIPLLPLFLLALQRKKPAIIVGGNVRANLFMGFVMVHLLELTSIFCVIAGRVL